MEVLNNNKRRFYIYTTLLTIVGWAWIACFMWLGTTDSGISVCIFKNVTGFPCPACGSTHAVLSIFSGNWWQAFLHNPIGYLIVAILFITPLWLIFDVFKNRNSLYHTFTNIEIRLKQRPYLLIAGASLIISNWIWNITKL